MIARQEAIQEALSFLRGIPWKEISRLAIPQILLMLTTLCISLTDMWVAGRISSDVQAVIGVTAQIQAFMMVLAMSLGSGAMAVISQSRGAKRFLRSRRYVLLVMYITILLACLFALLGRDLGSVIMELLDIPQSARSTALYFWNILLLALPFHYSYFVSNVLFRATKLVIFPLIIGFLACTINFIGDLGFGLGYFGLPNYGVQGVAWSTYASVSSASFVSICLLKWTKLLPNTLILKFKWIKKALPYLIKVALPALCTQALWQSGYLILFGIASSVPNSITALAGLSAGMRIESILFTPAMAFNATASILVGHELGARNVQAAKKIGITIVGIGAGMMSFVGLCMLPFMKELASLLSSDHAVIQVIVWYLMFNIMSTPFTVGGMILNGIMTGAGATIYALVVNTTCIWCIRLPVAYVSAHYFGMEIRGVFLAMLLSMAIQALTMLFIFFTRPWYTHAMRKTH